MSIILNNPVVSVSPHVTQLNNTTSRVMIDVLISLLPVVLVSIFFFGYLVLVNLVVCCVACFWSEVIFNSVVHKQSPVWKNVKKSSVFSDHSFAVTACILALNLPTVINVWGWNIQDGDSILFSLDTVILCILMSVFAIVVVKMLFGGLGRNFANPAVTSRVFLLLAFTSGMIAVRTNPFFGLNLGLDASSGASWLGLVGEGTVLNSTTSPKVLFNMFLGNVSSAAVGETSVFAIAIGYVYLVFKKVIDWRLPLVLIGFTAIFALVFGLADSRIEYDSVSTVIGYTLAHLLSGGLVFGAVFMATDYSTSPNTFLGACIFALGIALFTVLIRIFAQWPEGFSFSLLLMNIATPMIDRYIYPKPFGYVRPVRSSQ
ncbi:MAG: RnfABCDGE type electron transport complex subunit D [Clostridiales bacterium]|jgi:electron transport complex protein RnfD|nr:RnfABCDGE type electron transport complex subunit D [Clostridiales bacterium]